MATRAQLLEAITSAYKHGNPADAERLQQAFDSGMFTEDETEEAPFSARVGRGALDMAQGLKQAFLHATDSDAAAAYDESVNEDIAQYSKGVDGFDGGRLLGNIAASAPAMLIPGGQGMLAKTASGALAGGMGAGSTFVEGDDYQAGKLAQIAAGTTLGAAAPWLVKIGAKVASKPIGAARDALARHSARNTIDDAVRLAADERGIPLGDLTDDVVAALKQDAAEQAKMTGAVDPAISARKSRLQAAGFTDDAAPTRAQATRSPIDWQEERNLSNIQGVGDDIRTRYMAQQRQLHANAAWLADQLGPQVDDYAVGTNLRDIASQTARVAQRQVGKEYTDAAAMFGPDDLIADPDVLGQRLTGAYDEWSDLIPGPVKTRMDDLVTGKLRPNVENVNKAVKFINKRNPVAPDEQAALREVRAALNASLDETAEIGGAGAEKLRQASQLAAKRFNMIDGGGRRKIVKNLVDGKGSAEAFAKNNVLGGDPDELAHLKRYLTSFDEAFTDVPRAEGQEAWNAIRSSAMRGLNKRAGYSSDGSTAFSGQRWLKEIDKLGEKRHVLFTPDENKLIDMMAEAARDITYAPAFANVNNSGTSAGIFNMLQRIGKIPMFGDAATGLMDIGKQAFKRSADQKQARDILSAAYKSTAGERAKGLEDIIMQGVGKGSMYNVNPLQAISRAGSAGIGGQAPASISLLDQ